MIPAHRRGAGRSERSFSTWQEGRRKSFGCAASRPPRMANYADRTYIVEFNLLPGARRAARDPPSRCWRRRPRSHPFTYHQRVVNRDNTVLFENRCLQIEPVRWRGTLSGCSVTLRQHLDGDLSLSYGQHLLGRYPGHGAMIRAPDRRAELRDESPKYRPSHPA